VATSKIQEADRDLFAKRQIEDGQPIGYFTGRPLMRRFSA